MAAPSNLAEEEEVPCIRGEPKAKPETSQDLGVLSPVARRENASGQDSGSRPSGWHDSVPATWRRFFTDHAATRLSERYGVPLENAARALAAFRHQIRGTHHHGVQGVNLGRRPQSDGADGTLWAVEIYKQVGFVVLSDDDVIVTVLPRDTKQLSALNGHQRAELEAFRTELHLRYQSVVHLHKQAGRSHQNT